MTRIDGKLEHAGNAIPKVLQDSQLLHSYKLYHLKVNWKSIMGEKIGHYSYIRDINGKKMTVAVTNPVWMNHLFMYKDKILSAVNEFCHEQMITDIHFVRAGKMPSKKIYELVDDQEEEAIPKFYTKNIVLPEEVVQKIRKATMNLPDSLGEKVRKLRFSQERLKIAYEQHGYVTCPICGRWMKKEEKKCFFCRINERKEEKKKIYDILMQAPWLSLEEVRNMVVCRDGLYDEVRRDCIYRLIEKVYTNTDTDEDDLFLTLFITRHNPSDLTDEYIKNMTNKYRRKDNVSSHRK